MAQITRRCRINVYLCAIDIIQVFAFDLSKETRKWDVTNINIDSEELFLKYKRYDDKRDLNM